MQLKRWIPLFSTNFFGVITDNYLKNLICFVGIYWVAKQNQSLVVSLAAGMLVIPFILFSPLAGRIIISHPKTTIVKYAKGLAVFIGLIASIGFVLQNIYLVMFAMFLMGFQSTIYSPAKYGLIKEIGGKEGISFGTGTLEMITFIGVLLGTVLAGFIADIDKIPDLAWIKDYAITIVFVIVSVASWSSSFLIKTQHTENEEIEKSSLNPIFFLKESFSFGNSIKGLNPVLIGIATFWLIASLVQMNIVIHCPQVLKLSSSQTSLIIALMSVGIGIGCGFVGFISKKRVRIKLAIIGGAGLALLMGIIGIFNPPVILFSILITLSAVFSGFMMVPLNSWIQFNVDGKKLGGVIAAENLLVFVFLLISAILFGAFTKMFGSRAVFLVIGFISFVITIFMYQTIPGTGKKASQKQ